MNRYREIEVAGLPREMGRQIGEAAGDEIRGFCDSALSQVNKFVRVSKPTADGIVAKALQCAERYSPDMVEELRGMAEAARVSVEDIMLLQVRNQLQPESDSGCTSLALAADGRCRMSGLVAQNWDNDPDLQPFTVVLTRRPVGKPALMTITQAGLIAYIGFNEAGIGVCLNTLPAPARSIGVPHYFTVRGIYETDSLEGAVQAVRRADRAIPANIMLATPQGPADLEVTLDHVHVLQDACVRERVQPVVGIGRHARRILQASIRERMLASLAGSNFETYSSTPTDSPSFRFDSPDSDECMITGTPSKRGSALIFLASM